MRKILALIAMCLMLTSCMRADMTLTISTDDKINGSMTIAFDEAALKEMGLTAAQVLENKNLFGNGDATGMTTKDFKQDGQVGKTYTFKDLPLSQLTKAFGSDGTSLTIKRKGDQIITTGIMDMSQGIKDLDQKSLNLVKTLSSTIKITYPGTIVATRGLQDGNTVTWVTKLGQKSDFTTVVNSDFVTPSTLGTPTEGSTSTAIVLGAVGFVGLLVLVTVLRRRKPSAETPAD